jgi:4-hydroxy-tetrahydrodipicolinate synthase
MTWSGVYPAVTTQFEADGRINLDTTCANVDRLIDEGVHGIVALGTVGENYSLEPDEKRAVLSALSSTIAGRVPLLAGVGETTTALACRYAQVAQAAGVDGLMAMPGLVYHSDQDEAVAHFRMLAESTDLPVMLYNNPVSYGVDLSIESTARLSDLDNIIAIKESTTDVRRISELRTAFGERFIVFCGVDDIVLPCMALGATGWISGLTNVFPKESVALYEAARSGRMDDARALFEWFLPLLRLDTIPKLVQCIKLCEQLVGRGSEAVRAPRLVLDGAERHHVERLMEQALATRPAL